MQTNAQNLQNYLSTWDNYREIWEINKDMFIKRYQNLNPQVASFDADIARSVYINQTRISNLKYPHLTDISRSIFCPVLPEFQPISASFIENNTLHIFCLPLPLALVCWSFVHHKRYLNMN